MQWIEAKPVAAKSCGTCTLCCKLFDVDWLEKPKPAGAWCHHCQPGKGCAIWRNVPEKCASYYCVWRLDPNLGPEWKPEKARFILTHAHEEAPLAVVLDPAAPDAHRREPYWSVLQKTARQHLEGRGSTIVIFRGTRRALLMPEGEIEIPQGTLLHEIRIDRYERAGIITFRAVFPAGKAA
jgi:hypothetical protein